MIFPWTKLKREIDILRRDLAIVRADRDYYRRVCDLVEELNTEISQKHAYYNNVLTTIAAEERPTSNATVKRMARMAREALR